MTQYTNENFKAQTNALFPTNGIGSISALDLRAQMDNVADSIPFKSTTQTTAPGVADDDSNTGGNGAFEIGDFWVNTSTNRAYICVNNTTGAAIWQSIGPKLTGTQTQNVASINDAASDTFNITVTGAALGEHVTVAANTDLLGLSVTAYVSAANTVTVTLYNLTGSSVNLPSADYTVWVN